MGWVAQYVGPYLKQIATENAVGVLQSIRLGGDRVYRQSSCCYLLRMGLPLLRLIGRLMFLLPGLLPLPAAPRWMTSISYLTPHGTATSSAVNVARANSLAPRLPPLLMYAYDLPGRGMLAAPVRSFSCQEKDLPSY
jgi:hypothetical protein